MSASRHAHHLAPLQILIIDGNRQLATLMQRVLKSLGFGKVFLAADGIKGLDILRENAVDFVITSWETKPMNGIDFIEYIRTSDDSPNQTLPIIMLTGKSQRHYVEAARDAGMTEFIVKPFNVRTLCDRIILMVNHPRNFIITENYQGPDRRRRVELMDSEEERRQAEQGNAQIISESDEFKVLRVADKDVTIIHPDYSLQEKIGTEVDITDIFSPENVQKAQEIIQNSAEQFRQWIVQELAQLEKMYDALKNDPGHASESVQQLYRAGLSVKSQSGIFGYPLATCVAEALVNLTDQRPHLSKHALIVIRKHIDVLYVIFQRNIQGMGGKIGQDLMHNLQALSNKYSD